MRVYATLAAALMCGMCAADESAALPSPVSAKVQDTRYWAGKGYWDRRHAAKLAEIAAGPKEYDFVFLGDSITHNWEGWSDPIDVSKVTKAYERGELHFPNGPGRAVYEEMKKEFRLLNLGVGGDSTQHVLWRLDNGEMDGYRTRGVMLMIGTNNSGKPEEVASGVKAILAKIAEKQPQAKVLLLPIFPSGAKAGVGRRARNDAVNAIIKGYADGDKVIWCDFNAKMLEPDGTLTRDMMPDLLHPLEKGYRIWRAAVEPHMRAIVSDFTVAKPVWVKGREDEINGYYGFAAQFECDDASAVSVKMSAVSIARLWVNGKFVGYGPARSAEGWMRVDEWPIGKFLKKGVNTVAIEVSSPRVNTFYLMDRPPFLVAEVIADGKVVAATGRDFKATELNRVKKVNRMSYQRGPTEFLRVKLDSDAWRTAGIPGEGLPLAEQPKCKVASRGAPYPDFAFDGTFKPTVRTTFTRDPDKKYVPKGTVDGAGKGTLKGYLKADLEVNTYQSIYNIVGKPAGSASLPATLKAGEGVVFEAKAMTAGFPCMKLRCDKPALVWLLMDEFAQPNGLPNPLRMTSFPNAFGWRILEPGEYSLENFEPTGFKVAHLIVDEGEVTVSSFDVRTYGSPEVKRARFNSPNATLNAVFEAAKRSLAWNCVDSFTDCPGRERGIYFGDTIFTGRGADVLLGDTVYEKTLYMNYAMAEKYPVGVPDGMIPMCYPSDVTLSSPHWIPNFGMWSLVQLADHVKRSGSREAAEAFRPRAMAMLEWFHKCRNSDGLLEKIPGWVFVEWSDAAKFVQDVSYLTNMTYVKFLDAMAEVYGLKECAAEADKLREAIRAQSWTGEWFCDNAKRQQDGSLKATGNCTESAQYFAFFSGVATKELYPELWDKVVNRLGPFRKKGDFPKLYPANMLFGYSIRFVLLSEAGLSARVLAEIEKCDGPMAAKTGSLWESLDTDGSWSCCHGFPSMAAWVLCRDALGLKRIDRANRTVEIAVPKDVPLDWCEGTIPVDAYGEVTIRWRKASAAPEVTLPEGWKWTVSR